MLKLLTILDRLFGRKSHNKTNNVVDVTPCTTATIDVAVKLAYDYLRARGEYLAPDVIGRLRQFIMSCLGNDDTYILLASIKGQIAGMVCCNLGCGAVWDDRLTGMVWMLYVDPAYRSQHMVVSELLQAVGSVLNGAGMQVCKIAVDDPELAEKYGDLLGFRVTAHTYTMEAF